MCHYLVKKAMLLCEVYFCFTGTYIHSTVKKKTTLDSVHYSLLNFLRNCDTEVFRVFHSLSESETTFTTLAMTTLQVQKEMALYTGRDCNVVKTAIMFDYIIKTNVRLHLNYTVDWACSLRHWRNSTARFSCISLPFW